MRRTGRWRAGFALLLLTGSAAGGPIQDNPTVALPARPPDALGASELISLTRSFSPQEGDAFFTREILQGNVPDHLRHAVPLAIQPPPGHREPLHLWMLPDYLAVGSNQDFLRVPLRPRSAQIIADQLHATLPTRHLVNQVASNSRHIFEPIPISPNDYEISAPPVWLIHHSRLLDQAPDVSPILLRRGLKKDIVITNQLGLRPLPERVAIYGWHRLKGQPIQPLSLVHDATYVDYSHGVRLVFRKAQLGNKAVDLQQMAADARYSGYISDEGPLDVGRYPVAIEPRVRTWLPPPPTYGFSIPQVR